MAVAGGRVVIAWTKRILGAAGKGLGGAKGLLLLPLAASASKDRASCRPRVCASTARSSFACPHSFFAHTSASNAMRSLVKTGRIITRRGALPNDVASRSSSSAPLLSSNAWTAAQRCSCAAPPPSSASRSRRLRCTATILAPVNTEQQQQQGGSSSRFRVRGGSNVVPLVSMRRVGPRSSLALLCVGVESQSPLVRTRGAGARAAPGRAGKVDRLSSGPGASHGRAGARDPRLQAQPAALCAHARRGAPRAPQQGALSPRRAQLTSSCPGVWHAAAAQRFPSWQVLMVDLRCHGDSAPLTPPGSGPHKCVRTQHDELSARPLRPHATLTPALLPGPAHSVASASADVLGLLRQLKLFPTMLIGHSFGGKVVMSMVQQFGGSGALPKPVQVRRLLRGCGWRWRALRRGPPSCVLRPRRRRTAWPVSGAERLPRASR